MTSDVGRRIDADLVAVLASARRRYVLLLLAEADRARPLHELATALGERVSDESKLEDERVDRERLLLYHTHLPLLDAHGLVDFDPNERTAALAHPPRSIAPVLETL